MMKIMTKFAHEISEYSAVMRWKYIEARTVHTSQHVEQRLTLFFYRDFKKLHTAASVALGSDAARVVFRD